MSVKVRIENQNKQGLPAYQTIGSAGMDLLSNELIKLEPMKPTLVDTGIKIQIPDGYEVQIRPRSGLATKGVTVFNSPGTIDCFSEDSKIKVKWGDVDEDFTIKEILDKKITSIISVDEKTGKFQEDVIKEIIDKGVKELYEIELENGKKIKVTSNHMIYTANGLKFVSNLTIEDELFLYC